MSDTDPNPAGVALEPPQPPPEPAPEPPPQDHAADWYDEAKRQYPNARDDRELAQQAWQSFRHAQNALQSRQPAAEAQPEEAYDPYAALPVDVDPDLYQRFQYGLQTDPQQTVDTVLSNPDAYPQQMQREAFLVALQLNPMQAVQNMVLPAIEERFQAWQEQQGQAYQPWIANTAEALGDTSENLARQMAPDYDAYRERVFGYLAEHPHELDHMVRAADIAERLVEIRDLYASKDARAQQRAQQNGAPPAAQPRGAQHRQTETRSTAARPGTDDASSEAFAKALFRRQPSV